MNANVPISDTGIVIGGNDGRAPIEQEEEDNDDND